VARPRLSFESLGCNELARLIGFVRMGSGTDLETIEDAVLALGTREGPVDLGNTANPLQGSLKE
jgi:hypothetical protein